MQSEITEKEQKYYERIRSSFIGQRIKEVYYEEVGFETDSECWELSDNIHSVDMNVFFRLENNQLLQIKWDNEFSCYGIGFENQSAMNQREGFKIINVSNDSNWNKLLDKAIIGIRVLWDVSEGVATTYSRDKVVKKENTFTKLPQTWELEFEGQKVWISTLEIYSASPNYYYWADHLSLIFTDRDQKKYQLIERASTKYCI